MHITQPLLNKLFLAENIMWTEQAERLALQMHLAFGGEVDQGSCKWTLEVPRGEINQWRSFNECATYDLVTSREAYQALWERLFPYKTKTYTFITNISSDGLTLTVFDGLKTTVYSRSCGEFMIPQVSQILKLVLAEILLIS